MSYPPHATRGALTSGVDIGYMDKNGNNALHIACQSGHKKIVRKILYYYWESNRIKKKVVEKKPTSPTHLDLSNIDATNATINVTTLTANVTANNITAISAEPTSERNSAAGKKK